jgi:hypothetical protein
MPNLFEMIILILGDKIILDAQIYENAPTIRMGE